jgi:hypothetical protein
LEVGLWIVEQKIPEQEHPCKNAQKLDSEEYRTDAPQAIAAAKSSCNSSNKSSNNRKHQVIHQAGF